MNLIQVSTRPFHFSKKNSYPVHLCIEKTCFIFIDVFKPSWSILGFELSGQQEFVEFLAMFPFLAKRMKNYTGQVDKKVECLKNCMGHLSCFIPDFLIYPISCSNLPWFNGRFLPVQMEDLPQKASFENLQK